MGSWEPQDEIESLIGQTRFSRRRLLRYAGAAAVGLPALGACSGGDETQPAVTNGAPAKRGGTLRVVTSNILIGEADLDPASPNRWHQGLLAIYNTLVQPDENLLPAPALAETWEPGSTAATWMFKLRSGVTFHDGRPLTSKDVAYTFQRILDPDLGSPGASVLEPLLGTYDTPDDLTVVFNLDQPHADFPILAMHYTTNIIPEGSADTIGKSGIGTGPFKLEEFVPDGNSRLVANESYWRGRPPLDGVEFVNVGDPQAGTSALLGDQGDFLDNLSFAEAEQVGGNSNYVVQDVPAGDWADLTMRTDRKPFTDVRVRRALKLVVNPESMIQTIAQGHGEAAADNPVPLFDPYRIDISQTQDVEQARALLADAGYGDGLEITLVTSTAEAVMPLLAVAYKEMAAQAGVKVNIKQHPPDTYWDEVWLKADFCTSTWSQRPADQLLNEVFRSTASWNDTHWTNAKFDSLLDGAREEVDLDKRRALYAEAQQLIVEDGGKIIPMFTNRLRAMNKRVRGISPAQQDLDYFTISLA